MQILQTAAAVLALVDPLAASLHSSIRLHALFIYRLRPAADPNFFSDFFQNLNLVVYLKSLKIWVFGFFGGHLRISHTFLLRNAIGNTPGDAKT